MYRKLILLIAGLLLFAPVTVKASYSAMSCHSKQVLAGNQQHAIQSVASISKVMTAIVAVEHADLDELVTINEQITKINGSSIYLNIGQTVTMRTLLYGLLLRSGNDAAIAIADHIGNGSVDRFVGYMNDKAAQLGMMNTYFLNPSGLDDHDAGNQSTAYDMSLLMCTSLQYPILQEIMSTKTYKTEYDHVWSNKNRLLQLYPYTTGGKTGFTKKAGRTLISSAWNGYPIAIATFRVADDFSFHKKLYESLYQTYKSYILVRKGNYYYQSRQYLVEQDLIVITDQYDPSKVTISYDTNTRELVVSYEHKTGKQVYKIPGRKGKP